MEENARIRNSRIWDSPPLSFDRGCRVCVQSESGGGKSSLLSFIYGDRDDYQGTIRFDNIDIRKIDMKGWCEVRKKHIALMPQEMRLFPELTALQNILLKNNLTGQKTIDEIEVLLEELGIADKRDEPVSRMSIGQQQRVAFIRTLCQPFDFMFLDEPVSHLDESNNRKIAEIAEREASRNNAGIISTSVGNHLLLSDPVFINL